MLTGGQEQNIQDIIQHIMENDPNRYGPPPASTKAISYQVLSTTNSFLHRRHHDQLECDAQIISHLEAQRPIQQLGKFRVVTCALDI